MEKNLDDRIALVTGAASGIGQATAETFESQGIRVIRVDLRDSDINADLSTPEGRGVMLEAATRLAPDGLDIVVACAGINEAPGGKVLAVNYFGAVATLEGLRPLLALRAPAHAIAIVSVSSLEDSDEEVVKTCLSGDEPGAKAKAAAKAADQSEYAISKRALALWLRRASVQKEWAGSEIFLNGIAPGLILTPMTEPLLKDPEITAQIAKVTPRAVSHVAKPPVIAETVSALVNLRGGYIVGQVLFVDGGSDAIRRPDSF